MTTDTGLNDSEAKQMLGHVHRIGMALSSFESELQGSPANTSIMKAAFGAMRLGVQASQNEIIALRDTKKTGGKE